MVFRTNYAPPRTTSGRAAKENRRQYNIALPTTGAELRLPSVSVPRFSWRLLSFVLVAIFGYLFFYLWTSPMFTVNADRVIVNGINRVSKEELLAIANIEGKPVFLVDPSGLEETLKANAPALEDISIQVSTSGEVTFDVVERVPLIAWDQHLISKIWWVDQNGMRFPAIGSSEGLVYVKAEVPPPKPLALQTAQNLADQANEDADPDKQAIAQDDGMLMEPELVKGIVAVQSYLPEGAELIFDQERGIGWKDPEYGWMVYFGEKLDQMPLRLKVYQAIVDFFSSKSRKPVLISVEYLHAPYYRINP
jgi:hypothetical protein